VGVSKKGTPGAPRRPQPARLPPALAGIVRPEIGSPFQAPPINAARFRPEPPLPNPAERSPMGLPPTPVSTGGGGRPRGRRRGTPGDFRFTN
jgi:hypothetical protein